MIKINSDYIKLFSYYILAILSIFIYGIYRCSNPQYKDPLENKIPIINLEYIDGWSLSHLLFFIFIGYQCVGDCKDTTYLTITFIGGTLWELFEYYYGKEKYGKFGVWDCNNLTTDKETENWWYAKYSDIFINAIGLIIGYYLKTKTLPFKNIF